MSDLSTSLIAQRCSSKLELQSKLWLWRSAPLGMAFYDVNNVTRLGVY
jgi:hypothetical protein